MILSAMIGAMIGVLITQFATFSLENLLLAPVWVILGAIIGNVAAKIIERTL